MDKTSSVLAALDAGKLPTTQQANQFIDWLKDIGITRLEPSQSTELSTQGQILADDLRGVLDAYKQLGRDKNCQYISLVSSHIYIYLNLSFSRQYSPAGDLAPHRGRSHRHCGGRGGGRSDQGRRQSHACCSQKPHFSRLDQRFVGR